MSKFTEHTLKEHDIFFMDSECYAAIVYDIDFEIIEVRFVSAPFQNYTKRISCTTERPYNAEFVEDVKYYLEQFVEKPLEDFIEMLRAEKFHGFLKTEGYYEH